MSDGPKLVFGPSGTVENPFDNKVDVVLATPDWDIRLQISAPGALSQTEDRVTYMRRVIDVAIARLLEARARDR